jgi:hypothetical protein
MTCVHCGNEKLTRDYTLRCTPDDHPSRVLELHLCTDCLYTLCVGSDIELATGDRSSATD